MPHTPPDTETPPSASWYREQVNEHLRLGDLDAALTVCEQGLAHRRWNERLWQARLNILRRMGRFDEALAVANDSSKFSGKARATAYFHKLAFDTYLDAGDVDGARTRLAVLAEIDPDKGAQYLTCLVRLAQETGDIEPALSEIEPRLDVVQDRPSLALSVADLLAEAGRGEEAETLLGRAMQVQPSENLLTGWARLLRRTRGDEATAALLDAHALETRASARLTTLRAALFEAAGDSDAALALTQPGLAAHPDAEALWRRHWSVLAAAQGRDAALAASSGTAADADMPTGIRRAAVEFHFANGAPAEGLRLLRQLAGDLPDDPDLALRLATAELEQGFDPAAALDRIDAAESAGMDPAPFAAVRATALGRYGFLPEAIAQMEALDAQGGLDRAGQFRLTAFMVQSGAFDAARTLLDRITTETPQSQANREKRLGEIEMHCGNLAQARRHLLRALALAGPEGDHLGLLIRLQILAGDYGAAWENHVRDCEIRGLAQTGNSATIRPTQTLMGHLLNEHRIYYGAHDGFGLRWTEAEAEGAKAWFSADLRQDPGSTPAAIGLLGALRRDGRMTPDPLPQPDGPERIPRRIGHYWDAADPPDQVAGLMRWNRDLNPDYAFSTFSDRTARLWLDDKGESDVLRAYRLTRFPAGKSDLFRLAWLWHEGGVWLDADDRCRVPLGQFVDHRLRFAGYQEHYWTVGNNFMAVAPKDPIIRAALDEAAAALAESPGVSIWLSSGPGAISRAIARLGTDEDGNLHPDIWIMPVHHLVPRIAPHVRLNYKGTDSHWVQRMKKPLS